MNFGDFRFYEFKFMNLYSSKQTDMRIIQTILSILPAVMLLAACDAHRDFPDTATQVGQREKIVASISGRLVCIADASKKVPVLGSFPLPVEVIPMAARAVKAKLEALGATVKLRNFVTDNGCHILDASGLRIEDPKALEAEINAWPGVVTVGLFAARGADVLLLHPC